MAETNAAAGSHEFVSSGNNSDFVKLIKEGAIFRFGVSDSVGTLGPDWTPPEDAKPFGYYSEDGLTIHPEAGDSNDFTAHNGDVVLNWSSGGYWTFQFAGLESKKDVVETYFDTTAGTDGSLTISATDCSTPHQYVIAGLTHTGNLIIVHIPKATVGEREDMVWTISDLLSYGMTLRTYKDVAATPYHFKVWGMELDQTAA
ncbi:MAG: hypothetical protein UHD09_02380 [Bifidobacterium sp.]|nr:hypothetical protein [Bifidobacterium sp.]